MSKIDLPKLRVKHGLPGKPKGRTVVVRSPFTARREISQWSRDQRSIKESSGWAVNTRKTLAHVRGLRGGMKRQRS